MVAAIVAALLSSRVRNPRACYFAVLYFFFFSQMSKFLNSRFLSVLFVLQTQQELPTHIVNTYSSRPGFPINVAYPFRVLDCL